MSKEEQLARDVIRQQKIIVDIYCRVSTDKQEDNTSLDEQEDAARQHCKEFNLIVGMVHREVFSGYQLREREKLDFMRKRYRDGKIKGVVIRTLDRLSRSQVHNAILMEEMEHHGVTLYCAKENIDDTSMGKFIRMVLGFVAEMEREKIMDRTVTGRINKVKEGIVSAASTYKLLYGFKWNDSIKKDFIIINEEEAEIIRRAAQQYVSGTSALQIKDKLNAESVPSPGGMEWHERSLLRILSDRRITGKGAKAFQTRPGRPKTRFDPVDLPDGIYPQIITEELFEQIQERRTINKSQAIRASVHPEEFLLRAGLIRCADCNRPMIAREDKRPDRMVYTYECIRNGHGAVRSKVLDTHLWGRLQGLADHVTLIEEAVALATSDNKIQHDVQAIERSISTWKVKAANYLKDLDDSDLVDDTRTAVRNALNNANKMVMKLEEERAQITMGLLDKERERAAYREILEWCRKVKEAREELTYQQKRDFLRLLGVVALVQCKKPYHQNVIYRVELALPAIQELISPSMEIVRHESQLGPDGCVEYTYPA